MPNMSADDILVILESEYAEAMGSDQSSSLHDERAKALAYYEGDMSETMPHDVDRSKAVSTDVADTVDSLMPSLMDIFVGGEEVVKFNPQGPEDVEASEQETDYINHVVMQQNPGVLVIHDFAKDALVSKVGVVKVWWDETEEDTKETFRGVTDDALMMLASSDEIEIVSVESYPIGEEPTETSSSI
jgi:hypothetical protein